MDMESRYDSHERKSDIADIKTRFVPFPERYISFAVFFALPRAFFADAVKRCFRLLFWLLFSDRRLFVGFGLVFARFPHFLASGRLFRLFFNRFLPCRYRC